MIPELSSPDYPAFLAELKQRILHARTSAARVLNRELILLYWDIGRAIVEKQRTAGWGEAVVERLSADLRAEFSDMRGFSANNLWLIRQFYLEFTSPAFLEQVVQESRKGGGRVVEKNTETSIPVSSGIGAAGQHTDLEQSIQEMTSMMGGSPADHASTMLRELAARVPWGHHVELLKKAKTPAARLYYLRATATYGWSRNVLLNQIKAGAYERALQEKKTHNFGLALPENLASQADEILKSRYCLEFLGLNQTVKERELEDRLVSHLQQFLLELGYGFCFVSRQHRLALGSKEYFVDLLFYHRFLKALVAFDLKIGPFEPEHAGKMDFYLNLLNDKERAPEDNPSIGVILCAEKNDVEVEFALKTKNNPIGVAEYRLQPNLPKEFKGRLPTAKQLADAVREALPPRK